MRLILVISAGSLLLGVAMIGLYRLHLHKKAKKNLQERRNDNFSAFLDHFKSRHIPNKVMAIVYKDLSKSTIASEEMPVRPSDDLRKVWGFGDDLNDFVLDLQKQLKIAEKKDDELMFEKLNTVEDLVIFLSERFHFGSEA
jgi:hypothetical protein